MSVVRHPTIPGTPLGAVVAEHMARCQMTLRDVEDATAIPRATLQRRIAGRSGFSVDEIIALARLFGITTAAMLAEAGVAA